MHLAGDVLQHHELLGDDMHLLTCGVRGAWPLFGRMFPGDLHRFESGSGHHASCGSLNSKAFSASLAAHSDLYEEAASFSGFHAVVPQDVTILVDTSLHKPCIHVGGPSHGSDANL